MKEIAIEIINEYSYFGILLLTMVESILPVIPAEFILTIGGMATTVTKVTKFGVVLFATMGELMGALILFTIGHSISYDRLQKLLSGNLGKWTHLNYEDIEKSKKWFMTKGKYTVLFSKCIPVVGSLISVPAGMSNMNVFSFTIFSAIGIAIWNTVLVFFGVTIKKCIDILINGSSTFLMGMAIVFFVCLGIVLLNIKRNRE